MVPCVIADEVAGLKSASGEIAFDLSKISQHEKRCAHVVFSEHIEQARCPCRIRAIVVGEGQLSRAARSDQCTAEELRAGPARSIGITANAQARYASKTDRAVNTRCQMRKHCW